MGLNIKNAQAEAEIRGLAAELGVGLTEAVVTAVREARAKLAAERVKEQDAWMARARAVLVKFDAMRVVDPRPWQEINDEMYDEGGAPV